MDAAAALREREAQETKSEAERALEHQNAAFEQVLESTMAGYWDWDIPAHTEYLSPTFKAMFGYEDHEIENTPEAWQALIHPDDLPGVFEIFNAHVESRGAIPFDNTVRYRHRDGSIVWVYCRGKVIEWAGDQPVRMVGSHVDVTDLKTLTERLERSNEALETFAHAVSHDLKGPLRTIASFMEILGDERELDEEAAEWVNYARSAARHMHELVDGVLKYARLSNIDDEDMRFSMDALTDEVFADLVGVYADCREVCARESLGEVRAPRILVKRLVQNLVDNALKYRALERASSVEIRRAESQEERGMVRFAVVDNGIGMPSGNAARAFLMFERLRPEVSEGSGIGLTECKRIVERLGGQISIESEDGSGTTVYFSLPSGCAREDPA